MAHLFYLSVSNVWDTGTLQPAFELQPGGDPENYNILPYIGAGPAEVEDLITARLKKCWRKLKG